MLKCTCTPNQIIGGDADVDHSQTIGGDTAKLLGGIYPQSPLVSAPLQITVYFVTNPK